MEKTNYEGREFFTRNDEICWDGIDDAGKWIGGTTYSRCLVWYKDGFTCSLSASADRKSAALDIVCPQTAVSLESGNIPQGMELTNEFCGVGFKAGESSVNVELFPPPFDSKQAEIYKEGEYILCESDGFKYYVYKPNRKPEDPNAAAIIWETGEGLVCLRGGIPYKYRNDFSEDVWNFIDAELALSITKQIGSVTRDIP